MQAVAQTLWNTTSLRKKKIVIQGLGNVGSKLANILFWEGAELIITDIDQNKLHQAEILYGAKAVKNEDFFKIKCDILSPCAMWAAITKERLSSLNCAAIAGAANNQLENPSLGLDLMKKNILYAPDYIINAGGIINAAAEFEPHGYDPKFSRDKVNHIYDTLLDLFSKAKLESKPTSQLADEIAEYNLKNSIGKRQHPIF